MVDLRADTASSSDKAEFTETEDRSRTHHLSFIRHLILEVRNTLARSGLR